MEKKKSIILTVIASITLILLVMGATFAYFQAQGGTATSADVRVTTYTTDLLTFTTGDDIAIYADQANFAEGLGNKSGETFTKAHLLANSKTNTATANYYVYLNVTNNTFEYTQEDSTPELLLQVIDPNGTTVTSLSGLEYKTVTDGKGTEVKGFDVTTFDGLATIANNYEIVANNEIEQTWTVKLVFVNLDADQTKNAGHGLEVKLMIQKEAIPFYETCNDNTLACWVAKQYTGTQGESNLYYHNSSLTNGAGDNSYRYAGASDSVNNFVCFGSDEEMCPDDNLYRIIGVFDGQVKLIKWDYANSDLLGTDGDYDSYSYLASSYSTYKGSKTTINTYYWNYDPSATYDETNYYNVWSYSELNTINLNMNYIKNIGETWSSKITETTWKVGGNTWENILFSNAHTAYTNEITSPDSTKESTYQAKVALMYTSDYGFAANSSGWTTSLLSYDSNVNDNWMYMGLREWTIVRASNRSFDKFMLSFEGTVSIMGMYPANFAVRPVFYLNPDVIYVSGTGEKTSPIRVTD